MHVLVFLDLVLLATKHTDDVRLIRSATTKLRRKKSGPVASYSLVDQVGLSTLLSVEDVLGQHGARVSFSLCLMAVETEPGAVWQTMRIC